MLAPENPADDEVFVLAPFAAVAAEDAFLLHAELGHHAARGGIAGEVIGEDSLEFQHFECVAEDGSGGFGADALVPPGFADPVAEFAVMIHLIQQQADGANERPVLKRDAKRHPLPFFIPRLERRNPGFRQAVWIRMRNEPRGVGYFAIPCEFLNDGGIGQREGTQKEPFGGERGLGLREVQGSAKVSGEW